ncbi:AAC(3) family N-acetyltransferase [Cohnella pontilimi]|uniref:Aminoglycoside N(3)-acetyltransferase n=1 Tax=Cohnella pontilimi TaxID=2564100 RepID=A0A4U0F990_9BACL|nr:AAC(3) family N-acetyltransferase [Cohnella pontilimi]TJY41038.1 AAC(3) family N-acetyltransferase [Cohnella pontilimi]
MSANNRVSKETILHDLRQLGVQSGMELLVHSSLSRIGYVEGGADTVIDALLKAVDPAEGTLLVPTLTGTSADSAEQPPFFDVKASQCWTGVIPETMRLREDAVRSLSPTHSVAAIGRNAFDLTRGHEDCWTTCGFGSPYYRLCRRRGAILLLGVTLESNTTFHTVEEVVGVPYHLQPKPVTCTMTDEQGRSIVRSTMLHDWGTPRNFSVLEAPLLAEGIMKAGRIGHADCFLIDAESFLAYSTDQLQSNPRLLTAQS